ncbi:hypothetical protein D3C80_1138630 [compost metagenome]
MDTHIETGGALGDGAADIAHAENAQPFAADLHRQARRLFQPATFTHKTIVVAQLTSGSQQQSQSHIRHVFRQGAGGDGDGNAVFTGVIQINRVSAYAEYRNQPEVG